MPLSKFFSDYDVRDLIAFAYTIIFQTFNIVGDNLTFMVTKVKQNKVIPVNPQGPQEEDGANDDDADDDMGDYEEEDVDYVYFSPIVYIVKIPLRFLDSILDQMLIMLIEKEYLWYRTPSKYHDYILSPCPLSAYWDTPYEFKRMPKVPKVDNAIDDDDDAADNDDAADDVIAVDTLGDYNIYREAVSPSKDLRLYAYAIIQGFIAQVSSLTEIKQFLADQSNIPIYKYWDRTPVREMGEKEFWATFDKYVGQALSKLASFENKVDLSNANDCSIKRVFL